MTIGGRINAVLLKPTAEWPVIVQETDDLAYLLNVYIAILAAIPSIAGLIGFCAVGEALPSGAILRVPVLPGLLGAVFGYAMSFVTVYLLAFIANLIAPRFGAQKNFSAALKLVVYSYTPVWIAGIFLLLPGLWFLAVLAIYAIYPLREGLPQLMKVPEDRALSYAATIVACALALRLLIGWIEAAFFSLPQVI
jgi:Yip1-like protein